MARSSMDNLSDGGEGRGSRAENLESENEIGRLGQFFRIRDLFHTRGAGGQGRVAGNQDPAGGGGERLPSLGRSAKFGFQQKKTTLLENQIHLEPTGGGEAGRQSDSFLGEAAFRSGR